MTNFKQNIDRHTRTNAICVGSQMAGSIGQLVTANIQITRLMRGHGLSVPQARLIAGLHYGEAF